MVRWKFILKYKHHMHLDQQTKHVERLPSKKKTFIYLIIQKIFSLCHTAASLREWIFFTDFFRLKQLRRLTIYCSLFDLSIFFNFILFRYTFVMISSLLNMKRLIFLREDETVYFDRYRFTSLSCLNKIYENRHLAMFFRNMSPFVTSRMLKK